MTNSSYLNEPKVAFWKKSLTDAGCVINRIEPLSLYNPPNGELLFALLKADVTAPDGNKLPPIIFIRGHACIIIPLLKNSATGVKRYLMVQQRRIATGAVSLEFPAGMLDRDIDNPAGVALNELCEETGLTITEDMLFAISDKPLYSSPGASDEGIYYFGCIVTLDNTAFHSLEGRLRGKLSENEHIRVTLKTREEAENQLISLPARLGFFLFDEYCSKKKLS